MARDTTKLFPIKEGEGREKGGRRRMARDITKLFPIKESGH
jgi:hypothetical protein